MDTFIRLFTGLILAATFAGNAAAAARPLNTAGINSRLDEVIRAQMTRELRQQDPLKPLPSDLTPKVRKFKIEAPDSFLDQCPCFEYVHRRTTRQPVL